MSATASRPLLYVADPHLTDRDPETDSFIGFLERAGAFAGTVCVLGDLFNIWFGERKFRRPYQQRVLDAAARIAAAGVLVKFVEGNRDFSVRRTCLGAPFADVGVTHLIEEFGGRRILAVHGDEVNRKDRQYRMWKRFSKSSPVYGLFRMLPGPWGMELGERLERKLSGTNLRNKIRFPAEECRLYAEKLFTDTCDAIVMGHFHEEREMAVGRGVVYVVPTWRGHHRYLMFEGTEPGRFVDFTG